MKNEKDYMVLKQTFHQHLISEEIFYKEHPKFLIQKHNTFLDALQGTIYEKKITIFTERRPIFLNI